MLCLNLVYRNLRGKIMTGINSLILHPLVYDIVFPFLFFSLGLRKTPSPVLLVTKEPEKSSERIGKGTKSNKDLKRYMKSVKVTVKLGQSESNLV